MSVLDHQEDLAAPVKEAAGLVPTLRKNALQVDHDRRLTDENIEALTSIGFYRSWIPRRFGGAELDLQTTTQLLSAIGRGCASTGWVAATATASTWMAGHFPTAGQEEIFSTEDVRVCGSFTPTGTITKKDNGYLLNGKWPYNTGVKHAHWDIVMAQDVDGDSPNALKFCAVPVSSMEIDDDWHTYGLRGTGSCTTSATDVFIPKERIMDAGAFLSSTCDPEDNNYDTPLFDLACWPVFIVTSGAIPVGVAEMALDLFLERVDGRKITYTTHDDQRQVAAAHFAAAEAAVRGDAARLLVTDLADEVWRNALTTQFDRQRAKGNGGYATELARQAVQIVTSESGASSIRSDSLTQLVFRDMQAISMHAGNNLSSNLESYGRVLLGLEPLTVFE